MSASTSSLPPKQYTAPQSNGLPGVSKIKSSIRQTTRLLAKDTLEPGLRVATERRLISLQADLAKAEKRGEERKNGEKYHMVKFFEKKKLLRLITRTQKSLSTLPVPLALPSLFDPKQTRKPKSQGGPPIGEREKLEKELREARIMVNYIIHYPMDNRNTKKYISLFPLSTTPTAPEAEDDEPLSSLSLPPHLSFPPPSSTAATDPQAVRYALLKKVEGMMERGELAKEPEVEGRVGGKVELDGEEGREVVVGGKRKVESVEVEGGVEVEEGGTKKKSKKEKKEKKEKEGGEDVKDVKKAKVEKVVEKAAVEEEVDDFFE